VTQLKLLGRGLYSPTEASRLTHVPIRRVNRWTRGYWFTDRGKKQWSDPIVGMGTERLGEAPFLAFADLMEIRCLSMLRDARLSWQGIRTASVRGKQVLGTDYPFSSDRFRLVGRQLLAEVSSAANDRQLLDLVRNQFVLDRLVLETMRRGVHYAGKDAPQSWNPMGDDRMVVVNPRRAFGAPVVLPGGIRTRVLAGAYRAEQSHEVVAHWYNVSVEAVKDAVEFEASIRKAA